MKDTPEGTVLSGFGHGTTDGFPVRDRRNDFISASEVVRKRDAGHTTGRVFAQQIYGELLSTEQVEHDARSSLREHDLTGNVPEWSPPRPSRQK